jgi:nitroreductase
MNSMNSKIPNETVLSQLRWRYATKQFDPSRRISEEDWNTLEQSLVLTPSSFGLQPWQFIVITDQATKEKLLPASWNQRQVADASHLVVFAVKKDLGPADVNRYIDRIAKTRNVATESVQGFKDVLLGFLAQPADKFDVNAWATRQVYIALGNFLNTAALIGIDTCPMEGIDPAQYDEILGLAASGYKTVVVAPAGFRAVADKYAALPKVRYEAKEVIRHIG